MSSISLIGRRANRPQRSLRRMASRRGGYDNAVNCGRWPNFRSILTIKRKCRALGDGSDHGYERHRITTIRDRSAPVLPRACLLCEPSAFRSRSAFALTAAARASGPSSTYSLGVIARGQNRASSSASALKPRPQLLMMCRAASVTSSLAEGVEDGLQFGRSSEDHAGIYYEKLE